MTNYKRLNRLHPETEGRAFLYAANNEKLGHNLGRTGYEHRVAKKNDAVLEEPLLHASFLGSLEFGGSSITVAACMLST